MVSDFQLTLDSGTVQTNVTSGQANSFLAGNYLVSEQGVAGYQATFSGDCDASGAVTLSRGDTKICTITNNDVGATTNVNITLQDNGTGGDCTKVGAWDVANKTCQLNRDISGQVSIVSDGITLDGANHALSNNICDKGATSAIVSSGTNGVTIKNIHFEQSCYYGIDAQFVTNWMIQNNTFTILKDFGYNMIGVYIHGSDIARSNRGNSIVDNTFNGDGNFSGIHATLVQPAEDLLIASNTITYFGGIIAKDLVGAYTIANNHITTGSIVFSGTNDENKGLVNGNILTDSTIRPADRISGTGIYGTNIRNSTVSNNKVTGANGVTGGGIRLTSLFDTIVSNNEVSNSDGAGISALIAERNQIRNSSLQNSGGIVVSGTQNYVADNVMTNIGLGIDVSGYGNNALLRNTITGGTTGIKVVNDANGFANFVEENIIKNIVNGIAVYRDSNVFKKNVINGCSGSGILLQGDYNWFEDGLIQNCARGVEIGDDARYNDLIRMTLDKNSEGVYFTGGTYNEIKDSYIQNSVRHGFYVPENTYYNISANSLVHNNFLNNGIKPYHFYGNGSGSLEVNWGTTNGGNYWSEYDSSVEGCTDGNSDGFCDTKFPFSTNPGYNIQMGDYKPYTRENGWLSGTNQPPVITVAPVTINLKVGDTYSPADSLRGVTVSDPDGPAISSDAVTVNNTVNTNVAGTYTVTYSVADNKGAVGSASRTVIVSTTAPASAKFAIKDRIRVINGPIKARQNPGFVDAESPTQANGALGNIFSGPVFLDGINWWNIDYDVAPNGWSAEANANGTEVYLEKYTAPSGGGTTVLTNISDTLSSYNTATNASHRIKFTTPSGLTEKQVMRISFDPATTAFGLAGLTESDVTIVQGAVMVLSNANCSGAPSEMYPTVHAETVDFTMCAGDTIASSSAFIIDIGTSTGGNLINNPATAGAYTIRIAGIGATPFADSGETQVTIVNGTTPPPTNHAPTLDYPPIPYAHAGDGIEPNSGGLDTVFTFEVVYTDEDNDTPEDVTLHYRGENWADWSSSAMKRAVGECVIGDEKCLYDGKHSNGELYVSDAKDIVINQVKKYEYYFTTDDGTGRQYRLPVGSEMKGFEVLEQAQYKPPRLEFLTDGLNTGDGLYPNEGKVNTTNFQFKVKYSGIDLDKAQDVTVHIRRPRSGTYDAGGEFIPEIKVARNLQPDTTTGVYTVNLTADSEGEYQYYFTASDRLGGEVRLPSGNQVFTFSAYDDYYKLKVDGKKYYVQFSNVEDPLRPVPLKGERTFFDEKLTPVTDGTIANQIAYAGFVYETITQPTYQSNIATSVTTLEVLTEQLGIIASLEVLNECKLNVAVAIVMPPTTLATMANCALFILQNTQSFARIDTFLKVADLADDARSLNSRMGKLSDPSYILDYNEALEARPIMDRFYLMQPLVVPLITYIYELDKSILNSIGDSALSTLMEVPSLLPTGVFDDIISKYPNIENAQALHRVVSWLEFAGNAEGYVWYAIYLDEALDDNELQSFYYRQINLESINTKFNQTGNCASLGIPATCLSFINGQAHSPGELRITDKFGRITGQVNGEVYTQIPGSIFIDERFLLTDLDNTYTYAFIGNTDGVYGLSVSYLQDSRLEVFDVRNVPTTLNQNHSYLVTWAKSDQNSPEVELKVDQEGDGIIEHTFQVSNGLTDVISPTTTPILSGTILILDTYLGTTIITLNALDNEGGVGVASTTYSLDNGAWQTYATTSPIVVATEGVHTLKFYSTDWFGNVEEEKSVTFTIVLDNTPPTTTLTTTGTGGPTWFRSNVAVTLAATDNDGGTGVASTTYSLDNGTTWLDYSAPFTVTGEGKHTVLYRSTDKAGNVEDTKTADLYIDLTAPEARISAHTALKDLLVLGNDNLGSTTVQKTTEGYTITDEAGHTTKLLFKRTYAGKVLTYAKLTGIQYDSAPLVTLPQTSFVYIWSPLPIASPTLLNQTVVANQTFTIHATYLKQTNQTSVLVLQKGVQFKKQTFPGLKVVTLTTTKGVVGYEL